MVPPLHPSPQERARAAALRAPRMLLLVSTAALHLPAGRRAGSAPPRMCTSDTDSYWQGKTCLITGASSGLGAALALELSSRGATLMLSARREDRLAAVADGVAARGHPRPAVLTMDVADLDSLEAKATEAQDTLGHIDVLLCSAGIGQRTSAIMTSAEAHRNIMRTNFEGSVALTRCVLPSMVDRSQGHLVLVSSVQGFFGQPYRSSYAASKAAVHGYFDALRAEVAASGVRVTTVMPGYIATDHAASAVGGDGKPDENVAKGVPPEELAIEIADAVAKGTPELVSAPLNARVAIWLRACWPSGLFWYMAKKA